MSNAHFSRILILQSLPPDESPTGRHLRDAVEMTANEQFGVSVEFTDIQTQQEFWAVLERVQKSTVSDGTVPIIHFECHGNKKGLVLADRSGISWLTLKPQLVAINRASRCNLFVSLACCHGAMFVESLDINDGSPCWAFLGPSDEVDPLDLKNSFSSFFMTLLRAANAATAMRSLMESPERRAHYFLISAEDMFRTVLDLYRRAYSSERQNQERTEDFNRILKKHGFPDSVLNTTRSEISRAERNILEGIYNRFFFVNECPENRERFLRSYTDIMGTQ